MKIIIEDTDRKFTNVKGFTDGTDYIVVDTNDNIVNVSKEGSIMSVLNHHYSLDDCVEYVRLGAWKEIK